MRFEKYLAKLHLDSVTFTKIMDLAKVIIAQPGGVFLVGWLAIDGLQKIGYFGTPPAANSQQQQALSAAQSFLAGIAKNLPPGLSQAFQLGGSVGTSVASGNADADFLKGGLFAICMSQALGGGSGIATLGTAALAALK